MKKSTFFTAIFLLFFTFISWKTEAQIRDTLFPIKDNTLYEDPSGGLSNGAGDFFFVGMTGSTNSNLLRRGLLAFDVAASVPAGAAIISAELRLTKSKGGSGTDIVNIHRTLKDWGEGASNAPGQEGGGTAAELNDATWTCNFADGTGGCNDTWSTIGGDFAPTVSTSTTITANGDYLFPSTANLIADVQDMLDNPPANNGWLVKHADPTPSSAIRFNTKENGDQSSHPMLIVEYAACINGNPSNQIVDIEGDADVHGSLHVQDLIKLKPRACEPDSPVEGMIYYDLTMKRLRVYDGNAWQNCW